MGDHERPVDALLHPVEPSRAGWVVRQLVGERVMRERALDEKHRLHWRGLGGLSQALERGGDDARPEAVTDRWSAGKSGSASPWSSRSTRPRPHRPTVARPTLISQYVVWRSLPAWGAGLHSRPSSGRPHRPMSMVRPMSVDPPRRVRPLLAPRPRPGRTKLPNACSNGCSAGRTRRPVLRILRRLGIARQRLHELLNAGPGSSSSSVAGCFARPIRTLLAASISV